MKIFISIAFIYIAGISYCQDFRWEFRAYMLRNFVTENSIRQIKSFPLNDKKCPSCNSVSILKFDEQGKLIEMQHLENFKPKKFVYGYEDFPFYASKKVFSLNSDSVFVQEGEYKIEFNRQKNSIDEIQLNVDGDTVRINRLFFDSTNFIYHRTSWIVKANYWIITDYFLDDYGQLVKSHTKTSHKSNNDSIVDKYYSEIIYKNNRVEQALQFSLGNGTKDTVKHLTYYYETKNSYHSFKCRHQYYKDNDKISHDEYVINYTKSGFISELILLPLEHSDTTFGKRGKGFEYKFYTDSTSQAKRLSDFIGIYLSPNMVLNDTWR